jgi:hypothetical protein
MMLNVLATDNHPIQRLREVSCPVLMATGGNVDFFEQAADAIVGSISNASRRVLYGQGHVADPIVLAAMSEAFFV